MTGKSAALLLISCVACAPSQPAADAAIGESASGTSRNPGDSSSIIDEPSTLDWARETSSPQRDSAVVLRLPGCVAYEHPLVRVAAAVAAAAVRRVGVDELADVATLSRAFGEPHPWPRVWLLEGPQLSPESVLADWARWLPDEPSAGERRCGTALVHADDGRDIAAAVVVDVLADVAPLPLQARLGQWLRLQAALVPSVQATVQAAGLALLAPDGSVRSVPGSLGGGVFHAAFSLDQPGMWRLQASFDMGGGPRPALEAWVFVDQAPDLDVALQPPPGQGPAPSAKAGRDELRAALSHWIDGARRSVGVAPLRRDRRLDDLAQAHAEAMQRTGRTAHDVGDGLLPARAARAGLDAQRVGENAARATSLERAHRALWDSPSHRRNLLDPGFGAVGIGVVRTAAHDVWVCEVFADDGAGAKPPRRDISQ
jgi:cysteine-rich secretory family protein